METIVLMEMAVFKDQITDVTNAVGTETSIF